MAISVKGELGAGDVKTLVSNVPVSWSGTTTVYTAPAGINGFEIYRIILKSPNGTQPLTWSASQNGSPISGGTSLAIPGTNQGTIFQPSLIPIGSAGQAVTVAGITTTTGTALCTIIGVEF
jgi:hypothetical protein